MTTFDHPGAVKKSPSTMPDYTKTPAWSDRGFEMFHSCRESAAAEPQLPRSPNQ